MDMSSLILIDSLYVYNHHLALYKNQRTKQKKYQRFFEKIKCRKKQKKKQNIKQNNKDYLQKIINDARILEESTILRSFGTVSSMEI